MFAVNHGIDGDELRGAAGWDDRAVVTDSKRCSRRSRAQPAADGGNEFRLTEGRDGVARIVRERVHGSVRRGRVEQDEERGMGVEEAVRDDGGADAAGAFVG